MTRANCRFRRDAKTGLLVCVNAWCEQKPLPDVGKPRVRACPRPGEGRHPIGQPKVTEGGPRQRRSLRRLLPRAGDVLAGAIWLATGETEDRDPRCGCRRYRRLMNVNGWLWSWRHREEIRAHLEEQAADRGIYTIPGELRPVIWAGLAAGSPLLQASFGRG